VQLFAPDYQIEWHFWRIFVYTGFILLFSSDLWVHLRHFREPLARRILVENFALTLFFSFVPPLIAIGWYFAGWHGFRHLLRLSCYESFDRPAVADLRARMARLGWQALPFSLVSVVMLAGMFIWMADRVSSSFEGSALYLVLISALTLPHLIIVEWMDRRESIARNLLSE
jgi:Brp/Blh family beta-carotene 15,15'-monooxygenase